MNDSALNYFTERAYCWSSTAVSSEQAYNLRFYSDGVWPARRNRRSYGWSLRCVTS
ncbi:hypothetical protein IKF86_00080 [Candidatus Saccharibacteria bacterium]|nr:hypothetical protein [Candidatus Saccharibacteria bacterium]